MSFHFPEGITSEDILMERFEELLEGFHFPEGITSEDIHAGQQYVEET